MRDYKELEDEGGNLRDIRLRSHSYRNYSPAEFHRLIDEAEDRKQLSEIRDEFDVIEAGRMAEMLKIFHNFYWRLDRDEMELFAQRNPGILEWVNVWARLNHQQQFDVEGVESR